MSIVSLQDVRDAGVTVAIADDVTVLAAIATWEAAFEAACGQWFEPRVVTAVFDGDNTALAQFSVPIISVDSLIDLQDSKTIDTADYRAYTNRTALATDDRRNPKVTMLNGNRFWVGRQRWEITGTFGYTEPDNSTPGEIHYAMLRLIVEKLLTPVVNDANAIINQQLVPNAQLTALTEEVTDDHKKKWSYLAGQLKASQYASLTADAFVQGAIARYKAPMKIRTQANWFLIDQQPTDAQVFFSVFGPGVYS